MITESQIVMEIGGSVIAGWESFSVEVSMDQCSRSFTAEIYDDSGEVAALAETGAAVSIYAVGSVRELWKKYPMVSGYVGSVSRKLDGGSEALTVSGRGKTCDLVDCSAVWKSSTWTRAKFSRIVADLIAPYSIELDKSALTTDPTIAQFTLQNGETVFNAIERLCRFVGVLPLESADGALVLTYAAPVTAFAFQALTVGDNVESVDLSSSFDARFSEYTGKAQTQGGGKKWTAQTLQVKARATDSGVTRYRPLVFISESKKDTAELAPRVNWEAQIRAGRSVEASVSVQDFFQKNTAGVIIRPWTVNERVDLVVEKWDLKKELLITGVSYTMSNDGRGTVLKLRHPDTYKADPTADVELERW